MVSEWEQFGNDVMDDLVNEVDGLRNVLEHRHVPYDPEELHAELGERHLSVFPVSEAAQSAEAFTTAPGGALLIETYRVLFWEHAGDESARGVADVQAGIDLMNLAAQTRERFFVSQNIYAPAAFGGADQVRYLGTVFPDRSGQVRWFALGVEARRTKQAT